jgi:hypothetical protein
LGSTIGAQGVKGWADRENKILNIKQGMMNIKGKEQKRAEIQGIGARFDL